MSPESSFCDIAQMLSMIKLYYFSSNVFFHVLLALLSDRFNWMNTQLFVTSRTPIYEVVNVLVYFQSLKWINHFYLSFQGPAMRHSFTKIYYLLTLFEERPSLVQQYLFNSARIEYNIDLTNFHPLLPSSNTPGDYVQFQYQFRSVSRAALRHLHRFQMVNFFKCEFCHKEAHIFNPTAIIHHYDPEFQVMPCCEKVFIHKSCIPAAIRQPAWQCSCCQVFILYGRISNITFNQNVPTRWIDGLSDYTFMLL